MKNSFAYKHIFGPVPSRRLGYSLGIDIVPFKTCTYDCIYCQLGRTTILTAKREEFVSVDEIIRELRHKLNENIKIDYITLSGSGEPTLYSNIGELITKIKSLTSRPLAVLSNGSLLWDKDVQKALNKADLVIPSLDASDSKIYKQVNRPCGVISFKKMVDGLIDFSSGYDNEIWLEVFLLEGINSDRKALYNLNKIIKKINPNKTQLNTVKRPPAESFAAAVTENKMIEMAGYLDGNVEIIADFKRTIDQGFMNTARTEIFNLLKRRPCSLDDIAGVLNLHKNEIIKYLEELKKNNKIESTEHNKIIYYAAR